MCPELETSTGVLLTFFNWTSIDQEVKSLKMESWNSGPSQGGRLGEAMNSSKKGGLSAQKAHSFPQEVR